MDKQYLHDIVTFNRLKKPISTPAAPITPAPQSPLPLLSTAKQNVIKKSFVHVTSGKLSE